MATARMAFALRAPALMASPPMPLPWQGAAIDLDFARRKYWWGGAEHVEADFTTFTLNGSTFSSRGLAPTDTIDVSLALAGLGTLVPGAYAAALYQTAAPGAAKVWFQMDDNVNNNNRIACLQAASLACQGSVNVGGAGQAAINATTAMGFATLNVRHGFSFSYAANQFDVSGNGFAGTPDTAGSVPTVTRLRILKSLTATTSPTGTGILSRLVLFTATKTLPELQQLSALMRDNS